MKLCYKYDKDEVRTHRNKQYTSLFFGSDTSVQNNLSGVAYEKRGIQGGYRIQSMNLKQGAENVEQLTRNS